MIDKDIDDDIQELEEIKSKTKGDIQYDDHNTSKIKIIKKGQSKMAI